MHKRAAVPVFACLFCGLNTVVTASAAASVVGTTPGLGKPSAAGWLIDRTTDTPIPFNAITEVCASAAKRDKAFCLRRFRGGLRASHAARRHMPCRHCEKTQLNDNKSRDVIAARSSVNFTSRRIRRRRFWESCHTVRIYYGDEVYR